MFSNHTHKYHESCRNDGYYPENPPPEVVASIRRTLLLQWEAIQTGETWDRDRYPEAILAVLEGPLAWRRVPFLPAFDPGPVHAAWLDVWNRPDGLYLTLSLLGASKLGVRPVSVWGPRKADAGLCDPGGDATGNLLSGDTALMDGEWLPVLYAKDTVLPLFRWATDRDVTAYRVWQEADSLDAIGPSSIPDPRCQAEKEKVFTRQPDRESDRIGEMLRQAAG